MAHNPSVTSRTLRLVLAFAAFLAVAVLGMQLTGISLDGVIPSPTGEPPLPGAARDPFALVMAAALAAALIAYGAVEQRQTGELASLTSQLTPRALWLLPLAVLLDIALGAAAANGMALPLPMESTGTILVAMLAGPFAGALAGFAALVLWGTLVPVPYQLAAAPAFAVIAVATGLLVGAITATGLFRPRPHAGLRAMAASLVVLAAALIALLAHGWFLLLDVAEPPLPTLDSASGLLLVLGWVAAFVLIGAAIAGLARLLFLRDATVVAVAVAGLIIGSLTALARTPIAAGVLDGVTGFGFDPWVAAVTTADSDAWLSTLRTLLLMEPLDRMLGLVGVYAAIVLLIGATSRVRYPQGEWLVADDDDFALRVGTSMRATRW